MHNRTPRIQETLRSQDLAALVCGRPVNVLACTGYWPVVGNSIGMVTAEGATGLLVPEDEEHLTRSLSLNAVRTFKAASLDQLNPITQAVQDPLRSLAAALNCDSGRFAHDAGACVEPTTYAATFHFGISLPLILESALKARQAVNLSIDLAKLRAVLTESELDNVRQACTAAGRGFEAAVEQIRSGMSEREIARLLLDCISSACDVPRAGAFAFCMSGPNSADAYRAYQMSGTRALQQTDVALLHTNSFLHGYWTDITRTYSIGQRERRATSVQKAVLQATQAALDAIRPGMRACEVDGAARRVMTAAGFREQFRHATGHGVGLAAIDHNAHPRIHPKSEEVLEPGMVFNVEPAAYFSGEFGVRQCNMVAVTETGCELLTPFHSTLDELNIRGG